MTGGPDPVQTLPVPSLLRSLLSEHLDPGYAAAAAARQPGEPTRRQWIWQAAAALPRWGVTAFLPTVITSPLERIALAQQVVQSDPAGFCGATPLGLHVEGPFLNPQKKAAR